MQRIVVVGTSGSGKSSLAHALSQRLELARLELDAVHHLPGWEPISDSAVWLDLDRAVVTWRVLRRTVRRLVTREELWNGNREQWRNALSGDPERSIVRWAWATHAERRRTYPELLADPQWRPLAVHQLRTPREVRAFLATVA